MSRKLHCCIRPDLASRVEESECITVEIVLRNGNYCIVSSMYHPPNSDTATFLSSYNSLVCAMKKEKPRGIIMGLDHYLDFLKADRHHITNDFIQCNLDFGLIPRVTRPTHITNSLATLIDNIFVSQNLCGSYTSSVIINNTSDHLPTVLCFEFINLSKKRTNNNQIQRHTTMKHDCIEKTTTRL